MVGGEFAGEAGLLPGFAAGSRVAGYRLEEQIGAGGMAVVFRAWDERLGRRVALKLMAPAMAADEEFRYRFIRESRAAAAVDDPHIIPVFEAGAADGVLFIAMRYVPGGDVRSLVRRLGPLPAGRAAAIISSVASALDAAHGAGLVHRDVKPANMLVDIRPGRPDHVYLSDFGLSKGTMASLGVTGSGQFLGTPGYSAPEQLQGRPADGRADQYSLACAAFELLSGQTPFPRDQVTAMIWAHMSEPPPRLTSRRPELSAAVDDVLARALAKTPDRRYASCGQFADALRRALGQAPHHSRSIIKPTGSLPPGATWPPSTGDSAAVPTTLTRASALPHRHDAPRGLGPTRRKLMLGGTACAAVAAAGAITWDLTRHHTTLRSGTTNTPTRQPEKPGSVIWQGTVPVGSLSNGSPPELAASDGVVCVAGNNLIYALDAADGARTWNYTLPPVPSYQGGNTVNFMMVNAGAVYLACATVIALRLSDGEKLWSFGSGNGCLFAGVGNSAVYAETDFELCALSVNDGTQLWSVPADLTASPVASDGMVYMAGGEGNRELLWALRASNGTKIWDSIGGSNGGALAVGRSIVCGSAAGSSGGLVAWRKSDGKQLWDFEASGDPIISGDIVYTYDSSSRLIALRADNGKMIWQSGVSVETAPAIGKGVIYARIASGLIAVRAADGKPIWHFPISFSRDFPPVGPVVTADTVYVSNPTFGATRVYALRV